MRHLFTFLLSLALIAATGCRHRKPKAPDQLALPQTTSPTAQKQFSRTVDDPRLASKGFIFTIDYPTVDWKVYSENLPPDPQVRRIIAIVDKNDNVEIEINYGLDIKRNEIYGMLTESQMAAMAFGMSVGEIESFRGGYKLTIYIDDVAPDGLPLKGQLHMFLFPAESDPRIVIACMIAGDNDAVEKSLDKITASINSITVTLMK
jgi:hypothetical protein